MKDSVTWEEVKYRLLEEFGLMVELSSKSNQFGFEGPGQLLMLMGMVEHFKVKIGFAIKLFNREGDGEFDIEFKERARNIVVEKFGLSDDETQRMKNEMDIMEVMNGLSEYRRKQESS